jgi:hypothetical protein
VSRFDGDAVERRFGPLRRVDGAIQSFERRQPEDHDAPAEAA